ncbi:MAG TPA: NAD-dependent epimerase/dehydratase family protein [Pseudomonadales bacterium]|nr:NAD-dependent epimerase/dehydratase family protein [Pseudomonadales bacterium]
MLANTFSSQLSLVTGAGGFIGSRLLSELHINRIPVRVLLRKPLLFPPSTNTVIGELGTSNVSYASLLEGVDTVFHLANTAHARSASSSYQADCETTLNLAHRAREAGVKRFVFVSSTKAAAEPGLLRRDETWSEWPKDAYGYWKRMAEKKLLDEIDIPQLVIIRPCLVYGAGVKGNLDKLIRAIQRGYFPPLPDTSAERSMVSISDVVNAMLLTAMHPDANRKPLIVADDEPYTAYSIYLAIRMALGKGQPHWAVPVSLLKNLGALGDFLQQYWSGCPVSSEAISRLTEPSAYSAAQLKQLGWYPGTTFYKELPAIISTCLETTS